MLKGHLLRMIQVESKSEFDQTVTSARELIQSQTPRDGELESKFEVFVSRKENYASHHIATIPGNRGRHGNVMSEINHSSVLVFLNDGNKHGNDFFEHPMVLIRELLRRQKKQSQKKNLQLFGWK